MKRNTMIIGVVLIAMFHFSLFSGVMRVISISYRHLADAQNKKTAILLFYEQDGGPTIQ